MTFTDWWNLLYGGTLVLLVYFTPLLVARGRQHHQTLAIGVGNLLFGWTILGWCVCLVVACTAVRPKTTEH
jgi:Superinfection immunity protein